MVGPRNFGTRVVALAIAWVMTWASCGQAASWADEDQARMVFLEETCLFCHDSVAKVAGLDLENLSTDLGDPDTFRMWERIYDRIRLDEMPPPEEPRPDQGLKGTFLAAMEPWLHRASLQRQRQTGRVVLRRLNRNEYERTVQDLLGIALPLAEMLPAETPAKGFDTVAEGHRFSALQLEAYLQAANAALDEAIDLGPRPELISRRMSLKDEPHIRANLAIPVLQNRPHGGPIRRLFRELPHAVVLFNEAYVPTDLKSARIRDAGRYRIRVSSHAYQTQGEPVTLLLQANRAAESRLLGYYQIPAEPARVIELITRLEAGEVLQVKPFETGYDAQGRSIYQVPITEYTGRGLAVEWVEIEGPLLDGWPPPSLARVFGDVAIEPTGSTRKSAPAYRVVPEDPRADLDRLVRDFATRAYRREVGASEVEPFLELGRSALGRGESFVDAVRLAELGILCSPGFLTFTEPLGQLDDHALASRLSYFLWSTMPDEELLDLARRGRLNEPEMLRTQVNRLLDDPLSQRFVTHFLGQWLDLRAIDATLPDKRLYPEFDDTLQLAMIGETEAFFRTMLEDDLPIRTIVDSNFLTLNYRLARHYGMVGIIGEQFRRVPLPAGSVRGGLLSQASVLKVTANGTVTSPVLRGVWVQTRILGQAPPPPPPVPAIEPDTRGTITIREQLARHRTVESCNSCHRTIDPPGFALECFDVIGGFRDRYRSLEQGDRPTQTRRNRSIYEYKLGLPADSSGQLADGRHFTDVLQFKTLLLDQQHQITTNLVEQLLTYATGSGIDFADRRSVRTIVDRLEDQGGGLRRLIHEIVQSPIFQSK